MSSTNLNEKCSVATLKKLEAETRRVLAIAVREHGMDPETAEKIRKTFNVSETIENWNNAKFIVDEPEPLFPRLEK